MREIYTIKQGNHYASGLNLKLHSGLEKLSFSITPEENCLYNLGNENNMDINKFFGVTWGLDPDNNSFRIGWNCYKQNGLIQYHYYIHNHGIRIPGPTDPYDKTLLFEGKPGIEEYFEIHFYKPYDVIEILFDNKAVMRVPFNFQNVPNWGRYSFPYFGGDQTAPHDMSCRIKLL